MAKVSHRFAKMYKSMDDILATLEAARSQPRHTIEAVAVQRKSVIHKTSVYDLRRNHVVVEKLKVVDTNVIQKFSEKETGNAGKQTSKHDLRRKSIALEKCEDETSYKKQKFTIKHIETTGKPPSESTSTYNLRRKNVVVEKLEVSKNVNSLNVIQKFSEKEAGNAGEQISISTYKLRRKSVAFEKCKDVLSNKNQKCKKKHIETTEKLKSTYNLRQK